MSGDLKLAFKKGLIGRNQGLPTGIPKLDKALHGIQRGVLIGVGGSPKSGKSTLVDTAFMIHPYLHYLENPNVKLKIFYWSLEMDKISVRFRTIAFFFSNDYGIVSIRLPEGKTYKGLPFISMSPSYLMTKLKYDGEDGEMIIPTEEHQAIVDQIIENRINPMFGTYDEKGKKLTSGVVDIIEDKNDSNPTGIRNILFSYAKEHGTLMYEEYKTGPNMDIKQRISGYVPSDPDEQLICIIDHMRALKRERGFKMKENMDKLTEYQIEMKNLFNYSFIDIIHLNRNISDITRIKFNNQYLFPNDDDLKDSGNLAEDADYLLTMFDATDDRYGINIHFNTDISEIPNYRSIHLVRSRHSEAPQHIQTKIYPGILTFIEL